MPKGKKSGKPDKNEDNASIEQVEEYSPQEKIEIAAYENMLNLVPFTRLGSVAIVRRTPRMSQDISHAQRTSMDVALNIGNIHIPISVGLVHLERSGDFYKVTVKNLIDKSETVIYEGNATEDIGLFVKNGLIKKSVAELKED